MNFDYGKDSDRLKKTTVTISFDEEKVKALRMYLEVKGSKLEDELEKIFDTLYTKIVPAQVREYIGMASGEEVTQPAQKRRGKSKDEIKEENDG